MIELIAELEHKVSDLLDKVEQSKNDLNHMRGEIDEKNSYIHEVEESNAQLEAELEKLKSSSNDNEQQFNDSKERMRTLLGRINSSDQN
jgi:septal ring factor EnvC (AmiA/AmiB activator)